MPPTHPQWVDRGLCIAHYHAWDKSLAYFTFFTSVDTSVSREMHQSGGVYDGEIHAFFLHALDKGLFLTLLTL
jgi:hypothetical protein